MGRTKRSLLFLVPVFMVFSLLSSEVSGSDELFKKVTEIREKEGYIRKAVLLPEGNVAYFHEVTRPPTEEEKAARAKWFDEQWEAFRKEAEKKGIPEIERKSEEIAKELEKQISQQPPVVRSMQPFFSAAARGIPMLMRLALEMALPLARRHFINQPVVTAAGLRMWYQDRGRADLLQVDVQKLYGGETWMRVPLEEINLRASPDGRYLALESAEEAIVIFELKGGGLSPIAQIRGRSPIGWSHGGRLMFVSKAARKDSFTVFSTEDLREVISVGLIPCSGERPIVRAVAISDRYLAVGGGNFLCVHRFMDGSFLQPDRRTLRRVGGAPDSVIWGLAFSPDSRLLYITSARGFFVIDPSTFAVLDEYVRPAGAGFYFDTLAGVSPDGHYAAVLHGRERPHGWATLFFWDIPGKRILQRIGTREGQMLDTISSGFRFIYPPATLTEDWRFLLVVRQDGILELYRRR